MLIGVIGAMQEEVDTLIGMLCDAKTHSLGGRIFTQGQFMGNDVIVVYSRVGKVSAASTATTLINHFGVDNIIFTGIAGAVNETLHVGDIVIGDKCIQHDMDASPIFPKFEIPLTNTSYFASCKKLVDKARQAAEQFIDQQFNTVISKDIQAKFHITQPAIKIGTIASGDQFIKCSQKIAGFKHEIDNCMAVEMEGAAVSQVCSEYQIPFAVIRTISDKANEKAPHDFGQFLTEVASLYAVGIVKQLLMLLHNDRQEVTV